MCYNYITVTTRNSDYSERVQRATSWGYGIIEYGKNTVILRRDNEKRNQNNRPS